ncbi:hypothetical protein [Rhizobium leguminosarum]|uniref:hypothetical protein n=1 Tax=Rhizobium leguminosarum TaxID=384 RepID=UPI001C90EE58|nr:hypothetical protein [Rhizobium leguminosarum]MBY2932441.1 hypothetical protein [Rhizobium leguminosarum]
MHQHYKDILDRIDEPPAWFDDYGVPRYGDFSPRHLGNIYASEAALAEVSCQQCGRMFKVALTEALTGKCLGLGDEIRLRRVEYGDPPNVDCCGAGATMNSVMHRILEYWFRDYEVSMGWQRDPTFEGPVAQHPLDPPDTVAEVIAAVGSGAQPIRVMCTSTRNRYDLAGRITAAIASDGHVLVAYDKRYLVVARRMLGGLVPDMDVGDWKDSRTVTLAEFSRVKEIHPATINGIIVLAGPGPRNEAEQKIWGDVATWFATEADGKAQIELALAHSYCMIANPNLIVDAGLTAQSQ